MTTGKKIAIGCGVALALGVVVVVALGLYARSAFMDLRDEGRALTAVAEEFGRGQPPEVCIDDAFRQQAECDGLVCEASTGAWLQACLGVSARPPTFCDGVPPENEIMASVEWRIASCRDRGAADEQACGRLIASVQRVCHPPGRP